MTMKKFDSVIVFDGSFGSGSVTEGISLAAINLFILVKLVAILVARRPTSPRLIDTRVLRSVVLPIAVWMIGIFAWPGKP